MFTYGYIGKQSITISQSLKLLSKTMKVLTIAAVAATAALKTIEIVSENGW